MGIIWYVLVIAVIGAVIQELLKSKKAKEKYLSDCDKYDKLCCTYKDEFEKLDIPEDSDTISRLTTKYGFVKKENCHVWKRNGILYTFPCLITLQRFLDSPNLDENKRALHISEYPLSDIDFFTSAGTIHRELKISGGGSAEFSLKGAMIGGLIAGDAGMIVGSRSKTAPIKSETITCDERKTIIKIKDEFFEFDYNACGIFRKLIPEKEQV